MAYVRVPRPHRELNGSVVVASKAGEVLHLEATAAAVWQVVVDPTERAAIIEEIAQRWPSIDQEAIDAAVVQILHELIDAGAVREC